MSDAYLQAVLDRESVDRSIFSPLWTVQATIEPTIREWAGMQLASISPSGSFAKGTANKSGTDIDLFISLFESTTEPLKEIYETLFNKLRDEGYAPRRQNVSINIKVTGLDVDLVPGKRQSSFGSEHSLYRRRADTWTKTNIDTHVAHVTAAGRQHETRLIKIWRNQNNLEFPSFYLELAVINALQYHLFGTLAERVVKVFVYLRDSLPSARLVDPANTNNIVSEDLTAIEKIKISNAAGSALKSTWEQVIR